MNARLVIAMVAMCCAVCGAPVADAAGTDEATLARIRDAAMHSDWAWQRLEELTDRIGPRLSGSPQHAAAVDQVAAAMRALGAEVQLQDVKVPHWVRGAESGELVDYPGRPTGITQRLHLVALGSSGATPAQGLTAHVLVVRSMAELQARAAEARGAIVVFAVKFDQRLAENGEAGTAYGQVSRYRFQGPAEAAALGAIAALVRSAGGADYRLPHTGNTRFRDGQAAIPAAALAAEDSDLIERLAAKGPVSMKLVLTPRTLPDADSHNVIADWRGREKPDEIVVVSGHLDSWDLGTGAVDDGAGVYASAGVIQVLQSLGLRPRRTIRFIAWTNEENGTRGARRYFESVQTRIAQHVAAMESDAGAGRALGIQAAVPLPALPLLQPVIEALRPIGASVLSRADGEVGADIAPLQGAGVPGFAPLVDTRSYFDYHHTAADTLDKVDPEDLRSQVATMAVLAWYLAESDTPLPRPGR